MSYLVFKSGKHTRALPVRAYSDPRHVRAIAQQLRWKILLEVSREALCAKDLARRLSTSEQVVCYHIRRLEKSRLIRLERTERRRGAVARYYKSNVTAVSLIPDVAEKGPRRLEVEPILLERCSAVLDPFISGGTNFTVVVGSPTEHGEYRARARDGHYAANLMFFVGSLLPPIRKFVVRLDTEMDEHLANSNIIVVGGPRANTVAARINDVLPIRFNLTNDGGMISSISGRSYHDDEDGLICMINNPFNVANKILVLAGNTHLGTAASVIGFVKYTESVAEGNSLSREKIARIVRGLDLDSDGLIDDVKFLE